MDGGQVVPLPGRDGGPLQPGSLPARRTARHVPGPHVHLPVRQIDVQPALGVVLRVDHLPAAGRRRGGVGLEPERERVLGVCGEVEGGAARDLHPVAPAERQGETPVVGGVQRPSGGDDRGGGDRPGQVGRRGADALVQRPAHGVVAGVEQGAAFEGLDLGLREEGLPRGLFFEARGRRRGSESTVGLNSGCEVLPSPRIPARRRESSARRAAPFIGLGWERSSSHVNRGLLASRRLQRLRREGRPALIVANPASGRS